MVVAPKILATIIAVVVLAAAAAAAFEDEDDAPKQNAILVENALPGVPSTQWDVNGAGSDEVVGFATRSSYLPGDLVELKISTTTADETLAVEIYRLGWYGGLGAALKGVAEVDVSTHSAQPPCAVLDDVVDCGNWRVAARFRLAANATTGLYMARMALPRDDTKTWRADASKTKYDPHHAMIGRDPELPPAEGPHAYGSSGKFRLRNALETPRASLAFFVVRAPLQEDEESSNKKFALLVQTADTTWHAYNGWGGLTTYGSFEYPRRHAPNRTWMGPDEALDRAYKRSYNTPLITRDYRAVNAPFGAELPAIRFLERLGLDLHYATGLDMGRPQRAAALLARSTAYLSVGHDEYWSYDQREAVEKARAAGTHLFFWSANEAYWAIRFEKSAFGGESGEDDSEDQEEEPRTLVCYKETQSVDKLDPKTDAWTGTFRDARPVNPRGSRPENALSGTMFAANAQRNDALVVDAQRFGAHRLWAHTSVRARAVELSREEATSASSPAKPRHVAMYQGLLGHEWDAPVDNGWQPAYLQKLSETTVDNVQAIQDWGATFDSGTATHSLVAHRDVASGALTFGAATVQWSWGLDDMHDVNDPQRANKYAIRVARDPRGACRDVRQLTVNVLAEAGLAMPAVETAFDGELVRPTPSTDTEPPVALVDGVRVDESGIVRVAGRAADRGGGVVASVELSWDEGDDHSRWFAADLDALTTVATWRFTWLDEPWHRFHGTPPVGDDDFPRRPLRLRVSDDTGNAAILTDVVPGAAAAPDFASLFEDSGVEAGSVRSSSSGDEL